MLLLTMKSRFSKCNHLDLEIDEANLRAINQEVKDMFNPLSNTEYDEIAYHGHWNNKGVTPAFENIDDSKYLNDRNRSQGHLKALSKKISEINPSDSIETHRNLKHVNTNSNTFTNTYTQGVNPVSCSNANENRNNDESYNIRQNIQMIKNELDKHFGVKPKDPRIRNFPNTPNYRTNKKMSLTKRTFECNEEGREILLKEINNLLKMTEFKFDILDKQNSKLKLRNSEQKKTLDLLAQEVKRLTRERDGLEKEKTEFQIKYNEIKFEFDKVEIRIKEKYIKEVEQIIKKISTLRKSNSRPENPDIKKSSFESSLEKLTSIVDTLNKKIENLEEEKKNLLENDEKFKSLCIESRQQQENFNKLEVEQNSKIFYLNEKSKNDQLLISKLKQQVEELEEKLEVADLKTLRISDENQKLRKKIEEELANRTCKAYSHKESYFKSRSTNRKSDLSDEEEEAKLYSRDAQNLNGIQMQNKFTLQRDDSNNILKKQISFVDSQTNSIKSLKSEIQTLLRENKNLKYKLEANTCPKCRDLNRHIESAQQRFDLDTSEETRKLRLELKTLNDKYQSIKKTFKNELETVI